MQTQQPQIVHLHTSSSVRQVSPDEAIDEWPRVKGLIETALDGDYSAADVMRGVVLGRSALWVVEASGDVVAACVTEIIDFPRRRKCFLHYAAGSLEALNEHEAALENYAISNGCDMIETLTRKGMARVKPDWKQKYVVLQKEL